MNQNAGHSHPVSSNRRDEPAAPHAHPPQRLPDPQDLAVNAFDSCSITDFPLFLCLVFDATGTTGAAWVGVRAARLSPGEGRARPRRESSVVPVFTWPRRWAAGARPTTTPGAQTNTGASTNS